MDWKRKLGGSWYEFEGQVQWHYSMPFQENRTRLRQAAEQEASSEGEATVCGIKMHLANLQNSFDQQDTGIVARQSRLPHLRGAPLTRWRESDCCKYVSFSISIFRWCYKIEYTLLLESGLPYEASDNKKKRKLMQTTRMKQFLVFIA